jgi:pyruvate dehydrogenase E1 component alpha subunit
MARDPVLRFREWLLKERQASAAELEQMEAAIEKEIDEAVEFALSSPYPDVAELRRDVFAAEQAQ